MMKYLAFGLMAALLLDATVVRMFLVPSVMKLLGDDCWWAPRWMTRLQNRIGLGEINLPDERKRPSINGHPGRPPVSAASLAAASRAPHDPTHPAALEPPRRLPASRPEVKPAPSNEGADTTRMQTGSGSSIEPATTRLATPASKPAGTAKTPRERPAGRRGSAPARPAAAPTPPSAGQTRGIPVQASREDPNQADPVDPADPTAALPVMQQEGNDSDAATEKLNARGQSDNGDKARPRRRPGGGLSAQDLLRREGRL
jgi:trehalose monomycolate/heme transporter